VNERNTQLAEELERFIPEAGPLHVVVDDGNTTDRDLDRAWRNLSDPWITQYFNRQDFPRVIAICVELLDLLRPLTEEEREAALGFTEDT
jgi:hypothetical protein